MKMRLQRALKMIAILSKVPAEPGTPFGDKAKDLTEDEAVRLYSRFERYMRSGRSFNSDPDLCSLRRIPRRVSHVKYAGSVITGPE